LRESGDTAPWAVVATAHPAKFEGVVEPLIGRSVPMPAALAAMLERPAEAEPLAAEDESLKRWLRDLPPQSRDDAASTRGHLDVQTSADRA
jgi:threonine synthase